MVTSKLT